MLLDKLRDIVSGGRATVQIRLTRQCRVQDANGDWIDGQPGSVWPVSEKNAKQLLEARSCELVDAPAAIEAVRKSNAELLPPPIEPAPVPKDWATLPDPFKTWWQLDEKISVLRQRYKRIEDNLLRPARSQGDLLDVTKLPSANSDDYQARFGLVSNFLKTTPSLLGVSRDEIDARSYQASALERLAADIKDARERYGEKIMRAEFESSEAVVKIHGEMVRQSRAIQAIGFELFSLRVGSLGLADFQVQRLYAGSADWVRYHDQATVNDLANLKLGWVGDDGQPIHFIGEPVTTLADHYIKWTARLKELKALHVAATAELAKAKAAAA